MQAGLGFVQRDERRQAVAHEDREQADVFQRAVGEFMGPERPRHVLQLQSEFAPAALFPCTELGARECITDRILQIGGVSANGVERRRGPQPDRFHLR